MSKLNVTRIRNAKPGRHADGQGLYMLVSSTGAKSWVLRVQVHGRRRDIGLGSTAELGLEEARDRARELRKVAKSGRDPIAERNKAKITIPTFEAAVEACRTDGPPSRWSKRHAEAFSASLDQHAIPKLGRLLVDSVDENRIVAVLAPLWHEKPAASAGGAWQFGQFINANSFGRCASAKIRCHNIFYIKAGKELEYAPTGRCYTNKDARPQERFRRLLTK